MKTVTVIAERFTDARYARPRYRLRYSERQSYLRDGYTKGSYKLKRDAQLAADEAMHGYWGARAMRDGRYTFRTERNPGLAFQVAVRFVGVRIGEAPDHAAAFRLAGEHLRERRA